MTTHQNVSKHLAVLYQAGMVSRRKQGPSVRYALVDWTGWWLVEQMGRASRPTSTSCASSSATSPNAASDGPAADRARPQAASASEDRRGRRRAAADEP
jgi:DNA-binding transcriptional ArsR family regulator